MVVTDTPGVHLDHRLPHLLSPEELKQLHPRRRLTAYHPPAPHSLSEMEAGNRNFEDPSRSVFAAFLLGILP